MVSSTKGTATPLAFVLMWDPTVHDEEDAGFSQAQSLMVIGAAAVTSWSVDRPTLARNIQVGSRVFLRRVGGARSMRGIVGEGIVLSPPFEGRSYRQDESGTSTYVDLEWIHLVPDNALRPELVKLPLSVLANQGGSGMITKAPELAALDEAWNNHLRTLSDGDNDNEAVHPLEDGYFEEEERRYTYREVRAFQARFRQQVLEQWGKFCFVCELDQAEIIEAAHLIAHADGGRPTADNGRPLCANHHLAFDRGLIRWNPQNEKFVWVRGISKF